MRESEKDHHLNWLQKFIRSFSRSQTDCCHCRPERGTMNFMTSLFLLQACVRLHALLLHELIILAFPMSLSLLSLFHHHHPPFFPQHDSLLSLSEHHLVHSLPFPNLSKVTVKNFYGHAFCMNRDQVFLLLGGMIEAGRRSALIGYHRHDCMSGTGKGLIKRREASV